MVHLTIEHNSTPGCRDCGLCGRPTEAATGPHLVVADSGEAVCLSCGREHAPALAALLRLARVAERVGRIGRHTLVPPLNALLDLAGVAEDYLRAVPQRCAA
jgi:hypothetical protein